MIRKSGVVIAVLLMLWPVTVSAQRNDDFPDTEGWAYQLHGHEIVAYFDLVTGTPIRTAELNGVKIGTQPGLTYPTPESAVAAVEALIANHLDLFRFDPAVLSDVYVELQTYLGETWVVWYHQIYEGMWVTRSAVVVEIKMDGTIMHLSAQVYPNISVDTTPTVTLEDALAIARDRGLNAPDGRYGTSDWWEQAMIASSELVVNVEPKNKEYVYSLAWNLLLEVPEEGTGQAIVDAHTGEVYMAFGGPFVVHVDSPEAEQPPAAMERLRRGAWC